MKQSTDQNNNVAPLPQIKHQKRLGFWTLYVKEVQRFMHVYIQTVLGPVSSSLIFIAIFSLALGENIKIVHGSNFIFFLIPGLIMMSMIQNAFANTSSSLVISKIQGNIVDILMAPISTWEILNAFTLGGLTRGLAVGTTTFIITSLIYDLPVAHPLYILAFYFLSCFIMSLAGVLGGIWSSKFDQLAGINNFIITPLSFLSGTFYSIKDLPEIFQSIAHINPFFYMIDGFRYGFIGQSDASPLIGLTFLSILSLCLLLIAYQWLKTGYKIKT